MGFLEIDLGISTADADDIRIQFDGNNVTLSFTDWKECPCEIVFREVLAFRWQEFDEKDIRDDTTYELTDSSWLKKQAELQAEKPADYRHLKLCFNSWGSLDILAHR